MSSRVPRVLQRRKLPTAAAALRLLIVFLAWVAIPPTTQAAALGRGECRSMPSKILGHAVPYCVILPPSYDSGKQTYPVLYFLHGLGSNSEILINSGRMGFINDLWAQNKIG